MRLEQLQRWMAGEVMARPDHEPDSEAQSLITPSPELSATARLKIYREQYWLRTQGSLEEDFPALKAFLGEGEFRDICIAYLEANPSVSWTLRDLGQFLPSWLAQNHPGPAAQIAAVEWARIEAFDAAELPRAVAGEERPGLQPFVRLLEVDEGVAEYVAGVHEEEGGAQAPATDGAACVHLAVYREGFAVRQRRLDPVAFAVLEALRAGAGLDAALDSPLVLSAAASAGTAAFAARLRQWFQSWSSLGWFYSMEI